MALKSLPSPVKQPLPNGWELVASQAGMGTRGLRMMVTTMNGEAQAQHSLGLGVKTDEQRFINDIAALAALDADTIRRAVVKLAYAVEGVWRELRQAHADDN